MIVEFSKHRGYDMLPGMPVSYRQIVESADASENFLFDFRKKTIGDLTAKNHYDQLTTILHERGMGVIQNHMKEDAPSSGWNGG
jgi:hypothetical protein